MPAVEIVPAKTVTHIKGSVGAMPPPPATTPAPAAPPAPKVQGLPDQTKVTAAPVPPPLEPSPRKAASEVFDKLRNRNKPAEPAAALETKEAKTEPEPAESDEPSPEPEAVEDTTLPGETVAAKPGTEKKKVNPWKLVDEWKGKSAELEKQLIETKKLIKDEAAAKAEAERFAEMEKRAKELEDEIRYVNYQKHPEFQEKYEKPYVNAVKKAMSELDGIMVETDKGERAINPKDVIDLVNMPNAREAKAVATELFGDYAEEVMLQRNKIKEAWDARIEALENARQHAGEREKELTQQQQSRQKELTTFAAENWEKFNQAAMADPENGEFFREVEGDDERNTVLKKGFELVDTSTRETPINPSLTPEQRAAIIKKHVAVRNRAAAYGVVKHELKKARAEAAELRKKLEQYESSVPEVGGSAAAPSAPAIGRASDQVFAELRKRARH